MTSRDVPKKQKVAGDSLFEKNGNEIQLKLEHQHADVRIHKTLRSNVLIVDSDAKLKYHVENIDDTCVREIDNLIPKQYYFKSDREKQKHFGFLAQDIEKMYPNLVIEGSDNKTVNYLEIIPLLLSKIHNLQSQIDELKTK